MKQVITIFLLICSVSVFAQFPDHDTCYFNLYGGDLDEVEISVYNTDHTSGKEFGKFYTSV